MGKTKRMKTHLALLVAVAKDRIRWLQREIGRGRSNSGAKVRELERVQLFHSVVRRLNSHDAMMPEVVRAQVRIRRH
jgi:hypothetical protein